MIFSLWYLVPLLYLGYGGFWVYNYFHKNSNYINLFRGDEHHLLSFVIAIFVGIIFWPFFLYAHRNYK
jgi:hypothetical protein